ncbi:MAG: radical SAM protein [Muribaculaceae bacterium]|nr:radical SAM protein [Muribaculaceae bacterium]
MQTVLFHSTIFGPIHSRRLGTSLGVNLSPADGKVCTFDCLYCEAGFNAQGPGRAGLPPREEVRRLLREKLAQMRRDGESLDVITFSGNGEPTVHPEFEGIIEDTIAARDEFFPGVKISVLSNSTQLHRPDVCRALERVDNNILKLDSAVESTMQALDRPTSPAFSIAKVLPQLERFAGTGIVQTMLTRGSHHGVPVDNTTDEEISALIEAYRRIRPREIMIYTIDRRTPEQSLERIPVEELRAAAERITAETGIPVQVSA